MAVVELSPAWTTTSVAVEPLRRLDLAALGADAGRLSPLAWLALLASPDQAEHHLETARSYVHLRYLTPVVPDRFLLTVGPDDGDGTATGVLREASARRVAASLRTVDDVTGADRLPALPPARWGASLERSFIINEPERASISRAIDGPSGDQLPHAGDSSFGSRGPTVSAPVLLAAAARRLGLPEAGGIEVWSLRSLPVGAIVRATSDDGASWRLRTLGSDLLVAALRLTTFPSAPIGVTPRRLPRRGAVPARRGRASLTHA
ncbi:MAG: hypothetical protein QOJ67_819 [Acidimicrobiaceae bacterium]|jgi:hypothetical protein